MPDKAGLTCRRWRQRSRLSRWRSAFRGRAPCCGQERTDNKLGAAAMARPGGGPVAPAEPRDSSLRTSAGCFWVDSPWCWPPAAGLLAHRRKQQRVLVQIGRIPGLVYAKPEAKSFGEQDLVGGAAIPILLCAYSTGPPAARTGAPGEGTCSECHRGGSGGGKVELSFPGGMAYTPGVKQQLTVTVTDADARWYGFELSVRVAADNSQAGTLAPAQGESRIRVICPNNAVRPASGCPSSAPVEYIQHSPARQTNTFQVEWTPPAADIGPVRIYVAANAANGNGEPTGRRHLHGELHSDPAGGPVGQRAEVYLRQRGERRELRTRDVAGHGRR